MERVTRTRRTRENAAGYSPGRDVDATFSVWLMIGHIPFASTSSPSLPPSSSSSPLPSSTLFPADVKHAADVIVSRQISLSKAPDGNGGDEGRRERKREGGKKLETIQGGGGCYSSGGEKVGERSHFALELGLYRLEIEGGKMD